MSVTPETSRSGHVGLPVSGNDAKLLPNNGKLEVRAKGPNVMPGYWRKPDLTAAAFDEEGFYKLGDAIKPADPTISMPVSTSTAVSARTSSSPAAPGSPSAAAARFVAACAPLVRDAVIAGINRDEISALVVLDLDGCRLINPTLPHDELAVVLPLIRWCVPPSASALPIPRHRHRSSTRITRAVLLDAPLSIDRGEVTDRDRSTSARCWSIAARWSSRFTQNSCQRRSSRWRKQELSGRRSCS